MSEHLLVDDLSFEVRRSHRRATVGITVDRDGTLVVAVPDGSPLEQIERIVRGKLPWVYRKLAEKEIVGPPSRPKEFVAGEGFAYLGRHYRLVLVDAPPGSVVPPLRLHHGRFRLDRNERPRAHEHFVAWYVSHGTPWLRRRVDLLRDRIGVEPRGVRVRELGHRWGSCSRDGWLNFHWRTVLLPPRIIDYVVAHEMVHLHEPNHGKEFWHRLERVMPDFAKRTEWLAQHGGIY